MLLDLLDFVDSEAPDSYLLRYWSIFVVNIFKYPTFVLYRTSYFYLFNGLSSEMYKLNTSMNQFSNI